MAAKETPGEMVLSNFGTGVKINMTHSSKPEKREIMYQALQYQIINLNVSNEVW